MSCSLRLFCITCSGNCILANPSTKGSIDNDCQGAFWCFSWACVRRPLINTSRRVASSRPGKPGLTSFCETLGSTFLPPISLISENEATEQIKWSPGLQAFLVSPLFHLFSLISENEATRQIKWSQGYKFFCSHPFFIFFLLFQKIKLQDR